MAPKQNRKKEEPIWRRKPVLPADGALQGPQAARPPVPVPDPPPSSPAVIGSSSAHRNQPSPSGTQHRSQQGHSGRSPRGSSRGGRSFHPYPSSGRGRGREPPPVDGAAKPPVVGALRPPQVAQPPVHPDPPPSSPAVIGSSSVGQNKPSPLSPPPRTLQKGSTGPSPRGRSSGGRSHPYPSRGRGRGTQPPPHTSSPPPPPRHSPPPPPPSVLPRTSPATAQQQQSVLPRTSPATAQQQQSVLPRTSPATTTSPNTASSFQTPHLQQPATRTSPATSSSTPQQPQRVTRTSPATYSSPSPQTSQQHQPDSSSCSSGKTSVPRSPSAWDKPLPDLIKATNTLHANSFLDIIKNLTLPGENCPLYKAQVTKLAMRGSPVLVVDFEHLLTNIDLAVKVANQRSSSYMWLRSAVRAFFSEECSEMKIEGMDKFIEEACVSFINKPEEVFSLTDAKAKAGLVKVLNIIHGQETCIAPSAFGRELFLAILIYVLGRHKAGQSWDGNYCEEHVYFFRYPGRLLECRILKSISPGKFTATARKKDLGTVDSIMMPCYEDADGNLPVLFEGLHDDLKNSPPADVVKEWFMENLEFDLALMPPGARKILLLAVSNAIKSLKLSSLPVYSNILRRQQIRPDWRPTVCKDKGLLGGVYWFENKERDQAKDQYKATMESAVGYERNTHEHGHQHLDGEKRLDDFDEGELLIAMKQPKVLRKMVKDLMRLNRMGGPLAAAREIYCKSRAIQNEPAAALPGTQSGES
ncbi:hypothetical protein ACQJBY_004705 [Aegilops geniculata]